MTSSEQDDSVQSCEERITHAADILREGGYSIESLRSAAVAIGGLVIGDFPSDLRVEFAAIHEAITAEGSFDDSISHASADRAQRIIEAILKLAADVRRRDAIEDEG